MLPYSWLRARREAECFSALLGLEEDYDGDDEFKVSLLHSVQLSSTCGNYFPSIDTSWHPWLYSSLHFRRARRLQSLENTRQSWWRRVPGSSSWTLERRWTLCRTARCTPSGLPNHVHRLDYLLLIYTLHRHLNCRHSCLPYNLRSQLAYQCRYTHCVEIHENA